MSLTLIYAANHPKFQTPAGRSIGDGVIQPHKVYRPPADVCQKHRRLSCQMFWVKRQGRISLREQFYIPYQNFICLIFKQKADGLLPAEQIFPEILLLPPESGKGKTCCKNHFHTLFCFPVLQFLRHHCHCQQIIIVVGGLIFHKRLPPRPAHIIFSPILQNIL